MMVDCGGRAGRRGRARQQPGGPVSAHPVDLEARILEAHLPLRSCAPWGQGPCLARVPACSLGSDLGD